MLDTPPPVPSATPFRVIIVGAGIAGPVLGLFLKRKGSDVGENNASLSHFC